jgi:hypothetical protein
MIHPLTKTRLQGIPVSSSGYIVNLTAAGDPFNGVNETRAYTILVFKYQLVTRAAATNNNNNI